MKYCQSFTKKLGVIIVMLCCAHSVFSQDTLPLNDTIWIGTISNGIRNGYCKAYKNDTILSAGYFNNNVKEGEWSYYGFGAGKEPEIVEIARGNYKNGKRVGKWEEFYGYIKSKGKYSNDLRQGLWNYYDREIEGAPIILKGYFVDGKPEGLWQYFFVDEETGFSKIAAQGSMHNGNFEGEWKTYHWTNGAVASVGSLMPNTNANDSTNHFDLYTFFSYLYMLTDYVNDVEVNKTGVWNYYHDQNQLNVSGLYVNGKKEGEWIFHYETGNLKEKGTYRNGQKQGEWLTYHPDTNMVIAIENFTNDTLDGYCKYVCPKNNASIVGAYSKGCPVGEWRKYYNDTILYSSGQYSSDFFPEYRQMEYMKQTCNLFDINKQGYWKTYYPNGNIQDEGNYVQGKKQGEWRQYASAGYLTGIENYKDNELHGEYAQFNWHGKYLWQYGTFENGKRTLWMEYNEGDGPTTIAFLAERKQQLQVLDSIAVSAIASNFFQWYIQQAENKKEGVICPKFVATPNGMTTLDFETYSKNLKQHDFSDKLIETEKASYATCVENLSQVAYTDFLQFTDLDDFEQRDCDFTNYYRWTGGQEMMSSYAVTRVLCNQTRANVYGILFDSSQQPDSYRKEIVVRMQKQNNEWKIIEIKY